MPTSALTRTSDHNHPVEKENKNQVLLIANLPVRLRQELV